MKIYHQTEKDKGQALLELLIVLPVMIYFMMAVIPLIVNGVSLSWMDERLALRQLNQDDEKIHNILTLAHAPDILPPYFDKTELKESTRIAQLGISIPILKETFPGDMIQKLAAATIHENGWWNLPLTDQAQEESFQISRDITMVKAAKIMEMEIPHMVKRLTLLGLASSGTGSLERIGFGLFHLNLDALPEMNEKYAEAK